MVVAQVDKSIGAVLCLIEDINFRKACPDQTEQAFLFSET